MYEVIIMFLMRGSSPMSGLRSHAPKARERHSLIKLTFLVSYEGCRDEVARHFWEQGQEDISGGYYERALREFHGLLKACGERWATFPVGKYLAVLSIGAIPH
jgi:hypothetical protein